MKLLNICDFKLVCENMGFIFAALIGFIVMMVLQPLPILGPIIGGIVAGAFLHHGTGSGAVVGFIAGIFGALVLTILLLTIGFLSGIFGQIPILGALVGGGLGIMTIAFSLYEGVLGAIGGAIGGVISENRK